MTAIMATAITAKTAAPVSAMIVLRRVYAARNAFDEVVELQRLLVFMIRGNEKVSSRVAVTPISDDPREAA